MKRVIPYKAVIFDFDGVIVESTGIKTQAFHDLFKDHPRQVKKIVAYHRRNGGVNRFVKFRYIYKNLLRRPLSAAHIEFLGRRYASLVVQRVIACPFVPGALPFLKKYHSQIKLFVISGTPHRELLRIVHKRKLTRYFKGVYGAPTVKPVLARRILRRWELAPSEVLYIGDAAADQQAARKTRVRFVGRRLGRSSPFSKRVLTIPTLRELPSLLKKGA